MCYNLITVKEMGYLSMEMYYFFDEYGNCFREKAFASEEDATAYADEIGAEYFCTD
jgi:hypothetical protein